MLLDNHLNSIKIFKILPSCKKINAVDIVAIGAVKSNRKQQQLGEVILTKKLQHRTMPKAQQSLEIVMLRIQIPTLHPLPVTLQNYNSVGEDSPLNKVRNLSHSSLKATILPDSR